MKSSTSLTNVRKPGNNAINIPGTKVSFQNAQLLTSTGSSTLDFFIGGGLTIGTICIIEEDYYNSYSSLIMKYFLAEGVTRNHFLFLASGDKDPKQFLKELPAAKNIELTSNANPVDEELDDNLKIAWRYKNKCMEDTVRAESHNIGFDISKSMTSEVLEKCSISTWDPTNNNCEEEPENFLKAPYSNLYSDIKREIESKDLRTASKKAENILRIGINSIASPLWRNGSDETHNLHLIRFLYVLKALLRTSFAVAVITVPSIYFSNKVLISRIRQTCDTVIGLESFVGSDKKSNPLFKDFDGLLHIRKLPVLNTFIYPKLTEDLAFKLKKRGLLIERLHLPPELGDPTPSQQAQFTCSGVGSKLDF